MKSYISGMTVRYLLATLAVLGFPWCGWQYSFSDVRPKAGNRPAVMESFAVKSGYRTGSGYAAKGTNHHGHAHPDNEASRS